MNPDQFITELAKYQIKVSDQQKKQFTQYFEDLVTVNQHVNLTRITDQDEVYLKHFFDSITPMLTFGEVFKKNITICDVGAGAGFPSIPLKILFPSLKVTIVDSLNKRLKFLVDLTKKLGLTDVSLVHGRAEDIGQNKLYREKFDLVCARAVANLATLSEYCLPLAKEDGYFIALKGPKAEAELSDAQKAIKTLGGQEVKAVNFTLPQTAEERTLILIKKIKKTPNKYPRQAGTPSRKPIR